MTRQDTVVTVELREAAGPQEMTIAEVRQAISRHYNAANYGLAASLSTQVADQLRDELWPQYVAAEMLYRHQQVESGLCYVERALAIDSGHVASLVIKARLYLDADDRERAIDVIDAAIALAPEDSRLHCVKGELQLAAGEIELAREGFLRAIDLDPRNADALEGLSRLPGDNFSDELIGKVERIVRSRELGAEEQLKAHFALAQAYDGKGQAARHFAHLRAGNDLENRSLNFDPAAAEREARGIVEYFSSRFFGRRRAVRGSAANIVFIVGFPRCGSTLVEQILSSHPSVSAAGETYALRHAIRDYQLASDVSLAYPYWIDEQPDAALADIADDYLRRVAAFRRSACLTDKMLDNYKYVGMIHLLFPDAMIVDVRRNPIDACYSSYKRRFERGSLPFAYDLDNLATQYRAYRRVMRHWQQALPGRIHTVEYEALVERQEAVTRELLEYCGLPWDDACLDFHRNVRAVRTSSNVQVRQPLYADAIDRWKAYRDYLGPLLDLAND